MNNTPMLALSCHWILSSLIRDLCEIIICFSTFNRHASSQFVGFFSSIFPLPHDCECALIGSVMFVISYGGLLSFCVLLKNIILHLSIIELLSYIQFWQKCELAQCSRIQLNVYLKFFLFSCFLLSLQNSLRISYISNVHSDCYNPFSNLPM